MIHMNRFTPLQQKIVRDICKIQLKSLKRILEDQSYSETDLELLLIQNELERQDFDEILIERLHAFEIVNADPQLLPTMKETDISVFRHILNNLEDTYKHKYPKAISNLWSRLFILEEFNNQLKQTHTQN